MLTGDEVSRILDILGNNNRRRIILLLRQKPCFVTEISERLMISPKAVIEHLHLMENEQILSSRIDARRRKYYYISRDIEVEINFQCVTDTAIEEPDMENPRFGYMLGKLRRMMESRNQMITNLDYLERDINTTINELVDCGKDILQSETEINLVVALASYELTLSDMEELTGMKVHELMPVLDSLVKKGVVGRNGEYYRVCEKYGK